MLTWFECIMSTYFTCSRLWPPFSLVCLTCDLYFLSQSFKGITGTHTMAPVDWVQLNITPNLLQWKCTLIYVYWGKNLSNLIITICLVENNNGPHSQTMHIHKSVLKTQIRDSSICSHLNLFLLCKQFRTALDNMYAQIINVPRS